MKALNNNLAIRTKSKLTPQSPGKDMATKNLQNDWIKHDEQTTNVLTPSIPQLI